MRKSNLPFFEDLTNNGTTNIYSNFLRDIYYSPLRDQSKEYDEEKKIVYSFLQKVVEPGTTNAETGDVSKESFPMSFDNYLKNEIMLQLSRYLNWLNTCVETKEQIDVSRIVSDHSSRIKKLNLEGFDANDPILDAINTIKARLSELGGSFQIDNLIEQFSVEYSSDHRVSYDSDTIATYLKAWNKHKGQPEFRKKAKNEVGDSLVLPADYGLATWEDRFQNFLNNAQE